MSEIDDTWPAPWRRSGLSIFAANNLTVPIDLYPNSITTEVDDPGWRRAELLADTIVAAHNAGLAVAVYEED